MKLFWAALAALLLGVETAPAQAADQTWTISGTVMVEDKSTTRTMATHPIPGATVEIHGADIGRIYSSWGTVFTDDSGKFTLRVQKNKNKRHFKVRVRFQDRTKMLSVNTPLLENPLASEQYTIFETSNTTDGPTVNVGTRTFRESGANGELTKRDNARRAAIYYMCKKSMDHLASLGPGLGFTKSINVAYPAKVVSGISYANGVTRVAYIHGTDKSDDYERRGSDVVLHELMHLWNYQHNDGISNWVAAVCRGGTTHDFQEKPAIAFHEGFAEWAKDMLLTDIWRLPKIRPATRQSLAVHDLNDVATLEGNDLGVVYGLHLLASQNVGRYLFGTSTKAPSYTFPPGGGAASGQTMTAQPTGQGSSDDNWKGVVGQIPAAPNTIASPNLTFRDVLTVFLANPGAGWPKQWQVGNSSFGLQEFYRRAEDILPGFFPNQKSMFLELLDSRLTKEPKDYVN